jgi:hypothetical protein
VHDPAVTSARNNHVDVAIQTTIAEYWAQNPDTIRELAIRLETRLPKIGMTELPGLGSTANGG